MEDKAVDAVISESEQAQESPPEQIDADMGLHDEVFWADGVTATITAIGGTGSGLNRFAAVMEFKYRNYGGSLFVRTTRYKMTQPPGYDHKYRANINFKIGMKGSYRQVNSPDTLSQDRQWHTYEKELSLSWQSGYPIEIAIQCDFDGPDGGEPFWTTKNYEAATPNITFPTNYLNIAGYPLRVSGTNNFAVPITVKLWRGGDSLHDSVAARIVGSTWTADFTDGFVPGTYRVTAEQHSLSGIWVSLLPLVPQVSSPVSNSVIAVQPITVTGRGYPGAVVDLVYPGGQPLKVGIQVPPSGVWTTTLDTLPWNNELSFHTIQRINGMDSAYLDPPHKLRLLGSPPLTTHSANQKVEQKITVGGLLTGPFKSGTINVYRDATSTRLGTGNVLSTGGWSASITLTPGPYTVTTSHVYSSVTSLRSAPLRLRVRPSKPTITSALNGETVRLSGTGYNGADVLMHVHQAHSAAHYFDVPVNSGTWAKEIPGEFVPGNYQFSGKQSVSDGGSGRILNSVWADNLTVNVPTPVPTNVTVTVSGQRATFNGRGRQWGTNAVKIGIYNNGVALAGVPQADVQSNLIWNTTANADLAPGSYTALTARQLVNNQWSGDSARFSMIVSSPPPQFTNPPLNTPAGQRPRISGTAWPGSAILLKVPGKPDVPLTATGGSFFRDATEDWAPATYTITATAAFGGQTSPVASRTFTVKTPKPEITTAANAEVDLSPVLEGTGFKGCWVVIYSNVTHQPLGAGPVGQDNKWKVTLIEQVPANLTVYAIQQESQSSNNISDRTEVQTVKVRVPKPGITVPAQNGKPARGALFSGTGQYPGTVELSIKGQGQPFLKDIEVKANGTWEAKVTLPAGGPVTLEARQRQRTYASDPFERVVTVVPAVPVVDTPRNGAALGALLRISGFGYPGDTIGIYRRNRYLHLGNTTVSAAGTWSARVAHNMIAGDGISVLASAGAGLDSNLSPIFNFLLLKPAPKITEPLAGDWVGIHPLFSGLATPGASIDVASWFNTDDVLAPATIADAHGRWAVTGNKDLREGAMRVVVRQTVDGTPSEWFESGRFMVERKTAEFEAPAVHYPLLGQEVGRRPMFSGTGEPGAEVLIVKQNAMSTELGRTRVDRNGRWALRSQIELPVAITPYVYSVRQSRDGAISKWLLPHRSLVVTQVAAGFEKPVIDIPVDDATQVLERYPLFAGRGVPGAELKVYQEDEGTVLAITRVDAEGNWSVRNQFSLSQRVRRISTQQNMDGQLSAWSSTVSFNVAGKLDKPVFTYPSQNAHVSPHAVIRGTALPRGEVRLYQSGNPDKVWGRGVVDGQGQWVIVTEALPLGDFKMVGRVHAGADFSLWTTVLELRVIEGG